MMPSLQDIVVYEQGCGDYDLPIELCIQLGIPVTSAHPRELYHYIGLLFMMNSGAILCNNIAYI